MQQLFHEPLTLFPIIHTGLHCSSVTAARRRHLRRQREVVKWCLTRANEPNEPTWSEYMCKHLGSQKKMLGFRYHLKEIKTKENGSSLSFFLLLLSVSLLMLLRCCRCTEIKIKLNKVYAFGVPGPGSVQDSCQPRGHPAMRQDILI